MTNWQIRLSGTGGQGVIKAAVILAEAALHQGHNAAQSQVYGPESRGGSTKAEVVIAEQILYPKVVVPNLLLCMSEEACRKYGQDIAPGGAIILDEGLDFNTTKDCRVYRAPIVQIAKNELGNELCANVVALGVLQGMSDILSRESLALALQSNLKKSAWELNLKALDLGIAAGKSLK